MLSDDGNITFTVTPSSSVNNLGANYLTLDLSYPTSPPTTDYYSFTLAAGQSATLALTGLAGSGATLELLDSSGTLLTTGVAAANVDQVISNFVSASGGTYYANVIAGNDDYSLVVTKDADFDTEANSELTTAQPLGPALTSLGYLAGEPPQGGSSPAPPSPPSPPTPPSPPSPRENPPLQEEEGTTPPLASSNRMIVRFGDLGEMSMLEKIADMGATLVTQLDIINGAVVEFSSAAMTAALGILEPEESAGMSDAERLEVVADSWEYDNSIIYAEPDYEITITETIPNDSFFDSLWGMHNTGQTGGTPDADIDAPEAWEIFTGSSSVVIAGIDTGIDYNHPDLAANMWQNPGEVGGIPGVDDDGNGYIDDIYGIDTFNNDSDPFDDDSHGTHTAGTFGAVGDNGIGVAGVNWDVEIMALKFLSGSGSGSTAGAIEAIEYMTMMKVDYGVNVVVSNNSWGGGAFSTALRDAIQASNDAGILFVASAGNSGLNADFSPSYPGAYDLDGIISVAATDHNDQIAGFSNYGLTSVDLGAPGVSTYSTEPGNSYGFKSGTSMAAPHVAGAAAMLMAASPGISISEVKDILLSTSDPITALDGITVSGGRLNLANALAEIGDEGDFYAFEVEALDNLVLSTATPAGGPFEFVNDLDPVVELYDPSGNLVASDDNSAADGRNALLAYAAPTAGTYTARVIANDSNGEYVLNISGATGGLPSFEVLSSDPFDGQSLAFDPTEMLVTFSDVVFLTSVDASDFLVNGVPAVSYSVVDQSSVLFDFPVPLGEGVHTVSIGAGALVDLQGTPVESYTGTFEIDLTAPRILGTQWNGGAYPSGTYIEEGPLVLEVTFDEDILLPGVEDILLFNSLTATSFVPSSISFDDVSNVLTVEYAETLPEGNYGLTLISGDGAFEDLAGNDLDGEPLGPNPDGTITGNGAQGGNYFVGFDVDLVSRAANDFIRLNPLGGFIFLSEDNRSYINETGDIDQFEFFADEAETVAAVLTPEDPTATLTLQLVGHTGVITAANPGDSIILPATALTSTGVVAIAVSGDQDTYFDLDIYRNASLEAEVGDSFDGNEVSVDSSLVELSSGRYGVVGTSNPRTIDSVSVVWGASPSTGEIVKLEPFTGSVLDRFPLPTRWLPRTRT